MAITITNANLFSESFNSVKAFLESISKLDPRGRYKANWIHNSMPNINDKRFDGYPFIILKINVGEKNKSLDSSISDKVFRVLLGVYSNEPTEVDTISNSIVSNLKDKTKLTNFQAKEISDSPMAWDMDMKGKKISFRNIGFIGVSRI